TEFANAANVAVFINKIPDDGKPTVAIHALSPTEICAGDSALLSTDALTGATYQWYKDGQMLNGQTAADYKAKMSGSYTATRTNGGVTAFSSAIIVTVKTDPATPSILGTDTLLCQGVAVKLTSSMTDGNQWYMDGTALTDGVSQTCLAGSSGSYTVRVSANGCVSGLSNAVAILTSIAPDARITTNDPQTFCAGDSARLQANTASGLSYQWYAGSDPIPGATSATYAAGFSGNFTVSVSNNGCPATSAAMMITVESTPPKPRITRSGKLLVSSAAQGNQWYKNSVALPGETSQQYTPVAEGGYTVMVTA
ncbi:MAG: hypothetical protein ABUL46_04925, partial [Chitinophaga rupis]